MVVETRNACVRGLVEVCVNCCEVCAEKSGCLVSEAMSPKTIKVENGNGKVNGNGKTNGTANENEKVTDAKAYISTR